MFGDDVCFPISSTWLSEFGGEEGNEDDEVDISPEVKYLPPPVKTEMREGSEEDGGDDSDEEWQWSSSSSKKKCKKKKGPPPPRTPVSRKKKEDGGDGGGSQDSLSAKERQALEKREGRANMTPEQKEKERLRKQRARALERTRREEEMAEQEEEDGGNKSRSQRRSVPKLEVKIEVDSGDDEKEGPKKKRRRKKGGDEDDWDGGDEEVDEEEEIDKKKRRKTCGGGRRKKAAEMTEEEREAMKAKWREEARLKRQRQRELLTPQEREAILERQREQKRLKRAEAKNTKSERDLEEMNRKERERKKEKRKQMTPERRREEAQKVTMRRIQRLAGMTEEEMRMYRASVYMSVMARQARMTEEEIAERKRRLQEYHRRRMEGMSKEDKERLNTLQRNRRRRNKMKMMAERVENGGGRGLSEEQTVNRLMHQRLNWAKRGLRSRLQKKGVPPGEIEEKVREFEANYVFKPKRFGPPGETEEEKRERIRRSKALTQKKIKLRKKLEIQKMLESGMTIEKVNDLIETPVQRENRLLAKRINEAKRRLRQKLEKAGTSPSEIEHRLQELESSYQPHHTFRHYKPRPSLFKPIDPHDLALLSEGNLKPPSISSNTSLQTKPSKPKPSSAPSKKSTSTPATPSNRPTRLQKQSSRPSTSHAHPQYHPPSNQYSAPLHPSIHHPQAPYHPDYSNSNSYVDADDSGTYSPPPSSPPEGEDFQGDHHFGGDYSTENTFNRHVHPTDYSAFKSTTFTSAKKGRSRPKRDPSLPKKPKIPRYGPRGAVKSSKSAGLTEMCDECGKPYKADYLREHKAQHHNPNYQNQTCLLCGETFLVARAWHTHYNREHVRPSRNLEEAKEKVHMCDHCGMGFKQKNNLNKHKYNTHGDGLKKENHKRCPVCPEELLFKENISLNAHLKRKHPEYRREAVECYRCDQRFPNEQELGQHVKQVHPGNYWPCEYCNACRFTRLGLNFHYARCRKMGRERREARRRKDDAEGRIHSLDRVKLPCEICERHVAIFSLTRHYWEMHNVRDGGFMCSYCGKEFRSREFWAVHMEEKHERTLEQMREMVRGLNVGGGEGMEVENREGGWGAVKGNTKSKQRTEEEKRRRRLEGGGEAKRGRRKGEGGRLKRGMRREGGRRLLVIAEEDGGDEEEEIERWMERESKMRREIEEEDESEVDDEKEEEC